MTISQGLVNQGENSWCFVELRFVPRKTSKLGLQGLQVLVVRFVDLCFVQWGFLGPLKQVFIHIPIIAAENRAKCHVLKVKGIHQSNSIGADQCEQLQYPSVYL